MQLDIALTHPDIPGGMNLAQKFVDFVCDILDISPTRITITSYQLDDGVLGICIDESRSEFIILVAEAARNLTEVFVTIAHELIHVKQYMNENLGWFLDNRSYIPYMERWWELEAHTLAYPIVEQFIKELT